jgi:trehalose-6-phosphatase
MVDRDIIMVDFDGTLTKGGRFWTDDEILPNQEMIDWVNKKYREANCIIIFTARPYEVMRETVAWLIKHGVKYHGINMDKPGAQMYVDDKAFNLGSFNTGGKSNE